MLLMKHFSLRLLIILIALLSASLAEASVYWLSHCNGQLAASATPVVEGSATISVSTLFDAADLAPLKGNEIAKIRVGIVSKLKLDGIKVWIAESIDADPLVSMDIEKECLVSGWNEVSIPSHVEISGRPLYVGYTFTQPVKSNVVSVAETMDNHLLMLNTGHGWSDVSLEYPGALSVELGIEGDSVVKSDVTILSFSPEYTVVEENTPAYMKVKFMNSGSEALRDLSYTVGYESESFDGFVSFPQIASRESGVFYIRVPMKISDKKTTVVLNVNSVNGRPLQSIRTAEVDVEISESPLLKRNVLLEEFSNEYCGNCPDGAVRIHNVIDRQDEPSRVNLVVHHAGSSYDSFTIEASKHYESAFYSRNKYSPMAMYDRTPLNGAVDTNVNDENTIEENLRSLLSIPACSSLSIIPFIDKESGIIEVEAKGMADSQREMALVVSLTESGVQSIRQYGASRDYVHDNLLRTVNAVWGEAVNLDSDMRFNMRTRLDYDSEWAIEACRLIAFLTDDDGNSQSYRRVLQSVSLPLMYAEERDLDSGIRDAQGNNEIIKISMADGLLNVEGEYERVEVYDSTGLKVNDGVLASAFYIVRVLLHNGEWVTRKIRI